MGTEGGRYFYRFKNQDTHHTHTHTLQLIHIYAANIYLVVRTTHALLQINSALDT